MAITDNTAANAVSRLTTYLLGRGPYAYDNGLPLPTREEASEALALLIERSYKQLGAGWTPDAFAAAGGLSQAVVVPDYCTHCGACWETEIRHKDDCERSDQ